MRNYYKPGAMSNREPHFRTKTKNLHWKSYEALMQSFPANWRPEFQRDIKSAIASRNITRLFDVVNRLDQQSTMYTVETSLLTVKLDRQAVSYLKKFPFTDKESPFDTRSTAISRWDLAEEQCKNTNLRLSGDLGPIKLPSFIHRARKLIFDALDGDLTSDRLTTILSGGQHGPGSTLTHSYTGGLLTEYFKYSELPYTVTSTGARYAYLAITSNQRWLNYLESSGCRKSVPDFRLPQLHKNLQLFWDCVKICDTEKVTFVPKDAKTERTIGIGGCLDIYCQLAVKAEMQDKLKAVGVDLTCQERNKNMAQQGSMYAFLANGETNENQFSTIDMAMASDTISFEIVKLLLPPLWFAVLDDLRFKRGRRGSDVFVYNKFSAMGNGFTFPLESLIFWALAKASIQDAGLSCKQSDIAVYGDDIIVRKKTLPHVLSALTWAGFTVNSEKSFYEGLFKESCGGDYFKGIDVRPFYLKRRINTHADIYFCCNSLAAFSRRHRLAIGYHSAYRCFYAAIGASNTRMGPLDKSDNSLQVPLNFMRRQGFTPWLTPDEVTSLKKFSNDEEQQWFHYEPACESTDPVYINYMDVPRSYSGNVYLRLMMKLREVNECAEPWRDETYVDILHKVAARQGKITIKGKVFRDRKSVV